MVICTEHMILSGDYYFAYVTTPSARCESKINLLKSVTLLQLVGSRAITPQVICMVIDEVTRAAEGDYESLITVTVETDRQTRSISGTVFHDGKLRIVNIKGISVDAGRQASDPIARGASRVVAVVGPFIRC